MSEIVKVFECVVDGTKIETVATAHEAQCPVCLVYTRRCVFCGEKDNEDAEDDS